ncbi:hypothetical protein R1flu_021310 [Riccia fluitans]|uniref:TLC domain-containing protein n=1 Tax=Riccia fluitans TaxID=41844 RepID=A0ABD1ZQ55_9MARC
MDIPPSVMAMLNDSPVLWKSAGVFAAVYLLGFFMIFKNWKGRPRFDAASCGISLLHGTLVAILALQDLWQSEWKLDAPNTQRQNQIMEYSMAYFIIDLLNYVYAAPDDFLFIGHHIATFTYMFSCRYFTLHGATSVMCLIAAGEATSPVQNIWTLARMARTESDVAKRIYTSLSPFFTFYFTLVRGIFGPYLIYKLGKFYLPGGADAVVPRWLAFCWMFKTSFAIFGSMVWVYKLWVGLFKFWNTKDKKRLEEEMKKVT